MKINVFCLCEEIRCTPDGRPVLYGLGSHLSVSVSGLPGLIEVPIAAAISFTREEVGDWPFRIYVSFDGGEEDLIVRGEIPATIHGPTHSAILPQHFRQRILIREVGMLMFRLVVDSPLGGVPAAEARLPVYVTALEGEPLH